MPEPEGHNTTGKHSTLLAGVLKSCFARHAVEPRHYSRIHPYPLTLLSSIISSTHRKGTISLRTSGCSKLKQLTVKSKPGQGKHIKRSFFQNILADGDCATHNRLKYVLTGRLKKCWGLGIIKYTENTVQFNFTEPSVFVVMNSVEVA